MAPNPRISAALIFIALAGCDGSQSDVAPRATAGENSVAKKGSDAPSAEEVARSYSRLHLVTSLPVLVDPQLAMLCVGIWQDHVDDARNRSGPHAHTSIRIFMSDDAARAFRKSKEYPVGSIIVKEKTGLEYQIREPSPSRSAKTSGGVGGMIKRPPGYDPDHGDWEYFYFENPSKIEHGKTRPNGRFGSFVFATLY